MSEAHYTREEVEKWAPRLAKELDGWDDAWPADIPIMIDALEWLDPDRPEPPFYDGMRDEIVLAEDEAGRRVIISEAHPQPVVVPGYAACERVCRLYRDLVRQCEDLQAGDMSAALALATLITELDAAENLSRGSVLLALRFAGIEAPE